MRAAGLQSDMLSHRNKELDDYDGQIISVYSDEASLSFADVLGMWAKDEVFRDFFINLLADVPYPCNSMGDTAAHRPFNKPPI